MDNQTPNGTSLRGFASMDRERQREIASRGGRAAHERGTAHEFNSTEASVAARIGHQRGTAHEFNAQEARLAGRKGGLARSRNQHDHPQEQLVDAGNFGSAEHSSPVVSSTEIV